MTQQKKKRYYQIGETVFIKEEKVFGVIKGLNVNPAKNTYKATVDIEHDGYTQSTELDLWQIDKDKRKSAKTGQRPQGLDKTFFQVKDFHKAFNHPVQNFPTLVELERARARAEWMKEEIEEFLEATDVVGQADAMIDLIYFAVGTMVEMGVRPDALFDIVQGANMGKLHNIAGVMTAVYREDGKVKKPENWERDFAPEGKLKAEIERQLSFKK